MRVLLEFWEFCLLFFKFTVGLIRIWVLFEGGSLSRIYGTLKLNFVFYHLPSVNPKQLRVLTHLRCTR